MIYLLCLIANSINSAEYNYAFYTNENSGTNGYGKTFEQSYSHSIKNTGIKIVQIRAALEFFSNQNVSLYALKQYIFKNDTDCQAHYQFFSYLLHHLREKKLDGLLIEPKVISEPERYLLGTTQAKHAINYHFEDIKQYIFSLHRHDQMQRILPTPPDTTYLLDLKMNTDCYVLDIIDTTNQYVIGMALFDFTDQETLHLSRFYVAAKHRKQRLGKKALDCLTRFAKINNACNLKLFIQPFGYKKASGSDLINWYKHNGFKIINHTTLLAKKTIGEPVNLDKAHIEVLFN